MAGLMLLSLSGCCGIGNIAEIFKGISSKDNSIETTAPAVTGNAESTESATQAPTEATVAEETTVIADDDYVYMEVLCGNDDGIGNYIIDIKIENKHSEKIYINAETAAVNDLQLYAYMGETVDSGKTAYDDLEISSYGYIDIADFYKVDIYITVLEEDSNAVLGKYTATYYPNGKGSGDYEPYAPADNSAGQLLLDEKDIKITYMGVADNADDDLVFFIENNSDKNIDIYTEEIYINGHETDVYLSESVLAGCRTYAKIYLYSWDYEDAGIKTTSEINELKLEITVSDADSDIRILGNKVVSFKPMG